MNRNGPICSVKLSNENVMCSKTHVNFFFSCVCLFLCSVACLTCTLPRLICSWSHHIFCQTSAWSGYLSKHPVCFKHHLFQVITLAARSKKFFFLTSASLTTSEWEFVLQGCCWVLQLDNNIHLSFWVPTTRPRTPISNKGEKRRVFSQDSSSHCWTECLFDSKS